MIFGKEDSSKVIYGGKRSRTKLNGLNARKSSVPVQESTMLNSIIVLYNICLTHCIVIPAVIKRTKIRHTKIEGKNFITLN